jgi:hypothetical protein
MRIDTILGFKKNDIPYLIARFLRNVHSEIKGRDHCWIWEGSRKEDGYGIFRISPTRTIGAHRFSFLLFCGEIEHGAIICHHCDNPPCVNPLHLFQGAHQDNIDDCINKNRRVNVSGPKHGRTKLDWPDIERIRNLAKDRIPQKQIATSYGVSQHCIWSIVNYKTWANERTGHD